MIQTYLITVALSGMLAFGAAWKVQDWRFIEKETARVEQEVVRERLAAEANLHQQKTVALAQNDATKRAGVLRRDADSARSAVSGLRQSTDAAMQAARTDLATCLDRAAAISDVLQATGERLRSLGETADRHVSDIQTLTAAWPN